MKSKVFFVFYILVIVALCLSGCAKYRESTLIGKTSAQIEEEHGKFDIADVSFVSLDSSFSGVGCGYLLKESRVSYLGTRPAEYFFVVFDQNGLAVACYKGYHCNGG